MILLLLRIFIAPLVVLLATVVQRRFGHAVSGLLIGLPLTSLPLLWLVALQHGATFAGAMAGTTLAATTAQVFVIWAYARLAMHVSPTRAILYTLGAFVISAGAFHFLKLSALVASVLAILAFMAALRWWPTTTSSPEETGRYRLGLRITLSAGFTLVIVTLAGRIGPSLAGLAAALPVMSMVMGYVTHKELGANASSKFLHGVTRGSFSYVASIFVLTEMLRTGNVGFAFLTSIAVALVLQVAMQSLETFPGLKRTLATPLFTSRVPLKH